METLQRLFEREMATVPRRLFEKVIQKRLRAEGIELADELLSKLADHVLSGSTELFSSESDTDERNVTITH